MDIIETAIAEIRSQGFTIVRDLIVGDRLNKLRDDAEQLLHSISAKGVDGKTVNGRMHKGTFGVSRAFDDIIIHPMLLAVVNGVLDESRAAAYPHVEEMAAYLSQLASKEPGIKCNIMIKDNVPREDVRDLHRDVRLPVPHPHRPVVCNSLLAMDPFTLDAGATCVIPGSHRWEDERPSFEQAVPVEMDPGSIVIFDGEIWHGHGPNYSLDQYRRCLNLNYHYRWLQNFPNPVLPEQVWAELPEKLRLARIAHSRRIWRFRGDV